MNAQEEKRINARLTSLDKLIGAAKAIDYKNEDSIREFYFFCLQERRSGVYYPLDCFKKWFPKMFTRFQSIGNKRSLIKRDMEFMKKFSNKRLVFGSITFDNLLDVRTEEAKRKKAQRFLNRFLVMYELIEEYGEEHGRYHLHFLGVLDDNKTYIEFHNEWPSFSYIAPVRSVKKSVSYLCGYLTKQVPRIRRNKVLTKCLKGQYDIRDFISSDVLELPF